MNKVIAPLIFFFSILITLRIYSWITTIGDQFTHVLPLGIYYMGAIVLWLMITIIAPIHLTTSKELPKIGFICLAIAIFATATFGSLIGYTIVEITETAWAADASSVYNTTLSGTVWLGYILLAILAQIALPTYFIAKGLNIVQT